MFDKIKNIKLSKSVQLVLVLCFAFAMTMTLVSSHHLKEEANIAQVHINMRQGHSEHLVDQSFILNSLTQAYGELTQVPLKFADLEDIENFISSNDYVLDCDVYIDKNNELYIDVDERIPVCRVLTPKGSWYMDLDAHAVPLSSYYTPRVPIVFDQFELLRDSSQRMQFVQFLKTVEDKTFHKALMDQFILNADSTYTIRPLLGNEALYFGKLEKIEEKLNNISVFYKLKIGKGSWNSCKTLDVSIPGQVVCKVKNKS